MADVEPIFKDDASRDNAVEVCPVPVIVLELLQGEIERRNIATERWAQKLRAAATLSGVPDDAKFRFHTAPDGTGFFTIEPGEHPALKEM